MRAHQFGWRRLRRPRPFFDPETPTPLRLLGLLALLAIGSRLPAFIQAAGLGIALGYAGAMACSRKGCNGYATNAGLDVPIWSGLDTELVTSSVANLDRPLTINGVTVAPALWYKGEDGVGTTWPAEVGGSGGLLTEAGSGASPSCAQDTPLLGTDKAIKYVGAKYHAVAGNAFGDVTTEDMVFEFIMKWSTANAKQMFGKCVGGTTGYMAYEASDQIRFLIGDASGATAIASAALTHDTWYHGMVFYDRSGSGQIYINGVASGAAVDISARQLTLTTATTFKIGFAVGQLFDGSVSQCAMWQRAAWLDTHLQATVAAQRFRQLTGFRPQVSNAGVDTAPLSFTRATNATLQKYDVATASNKFFTVGPGWLLMERWSDGAGGTIDGFRSSLASTNKITYSSVTEATWTKADAGDTTTAVDGPWGTATAEGWVADATNGNHSRLLACTTTAAAHVFWVRAKVGAAGWIALYDPISNVGRYFNLATGALGGAMGGAPTTSYTVSDGGGWWIFAMVWTATAAARNLTVYPCLADGTATVTGDGATAQVLFSHAQCELGTIATSAIRTSGATATRNKDSLGYSSTHTGAAGAFVYDLVQQSMDVPTNCTMVDISDAGATNRARHQQLAAGDAGNALAQSDGTVTGTTDLADGTLRRIGVTWRANRLEHWVDGAQDGAADDAVSTCGAMTRIDIGQAYDASAQPSSPSLIRRVRVYNTYRTDMAALTTL